jgi:pimeloyl-ACP methyl ester carboxylesterase
MWDLQRRLRVGADEIAWDVLGDGPPVVLVHGFPSHSFIWRDVAARLAARRTVHLLDLIGFGQSPKRSPRSSTPPASPAPISSRTTSARRSASRRCSTGWSPPAVWCWSPPRS